MLYGIVLVILHTIVMDKMLLMGDSRTQVKIISAQSDAIREAIKEEMVRQNTEELSAGAYIVRYTSIISNRFDSTTFKRLYADLYKDFTKSVSSRRFSVSC